MLNQYTKKDLLKNNDDYDLDIIGIPDEYVGQWDVTVSHALYIVIVFTLFYSILMLLLDLRLMGIMIVFRVVLLAWPAQCVAESKN